MKKAILVVLTVLCITSAIFVVFGTTSNYYRVFVRTACGEPQCGGYVLVLRYSGQQGAGVKALSSLQQWIRDLNLPMTIVEPFIQSSILGIHPAKVGVNKSVRFGEMFDLDNFNAVSRSEGLPEMTPWSAYSARTLGRAVYVNMVTIRDRQAPFSPPTISWEDDPGGERCQVAEITGPDESSVSLCQARRVEAYWKFASTHALSSDEVYNTILGGLDPSSVTLIFSIWRGPWQVQKDEGTADVSQDLKYKDSQSLRNSVVSYQNIFLSPHAVGPESINVAESKYIAVMIRAEHSIIEFLAKRSKNISEDLENCLDQVVKETDAAMREVGASGLVVTSDVGYYGSGSWRKTISSPEKGDLGDVQGRVKRGVERLYAGRQDWTFKQWERSFVEASGGVEERGYVAALQRVLATDRRAGCLVLLGGGRFQELSLKQYLYNTRNNTHSRCIRMVCMRRKYRVLFSSILEKAI